MFLLWLLWLTIVGGGFFLGIGYGLEAFRHGGGGNILNAVVYCGCAVFALPKLARLVGKK